MPGVGDFETYKTAIDTANAGYGLFIIIVAAFTVAGIALAPYTKRESLLYGLIGIGIIARLNIMSRSFWYDETFTAAIVKSRHFLGSILGDVHPPLYYSFAKSFSLVIGTSEFALRLPSQIAGIALIYAIYRLTLNFTREKHTALLAAVFISLLGAPIYYSGEARYPMMLALAVISAMIGIQERRAWLVFAGAVACAYLHATGIVYAAVFAAAACFIFGKRFSIVLLLASSLWLPVMVIQAGDVQNGFWLQAQHPLRHIVEMTLFSMGGASAEVVVFSYAVIFGWSIVGVYMSREWLMKRGILWLVVALGVPLLLAVISAVWRPVYLSRALLAPALLLVIVWAYAWPRLHWIFKASLGVAVMLSLSSTIIPQMDKVTPRDLFSKCAGADYVYATSTNVAIQAMYYSDAPVRAWRHGNNLHQQLDDETKAFMGMIVVDSNFTLPKGEICFIAQVSYHTTYEEQSEINHVRSAHKLLQDETLYADKFYAYQLMRWVNE